MTAKISEKYVIPARFCILYLKPFRIPKKTVLYIIIIGSFSRPIRSLHRSMQATSRYIGEKPSMGIKPLGSICMRRAAANPLYPCYKGTFVLLGALCRLSILPFSYSSIASSACTAVACHCSARCPAAAPALEMSVGRPTDFFTGAAGVARGACSSPVLRLRSDWMRAVSSIRENRSLLASSRTVL